MADCVVPGEGDSGQLEDGDASNLSGLSFEQGRHHRELEAPGILRYMRVAVDPPRAKGHRIKGEDVPQLAEK
jgi:hypothetical protein